MNHDLPKHFLESFDAALRQLNDSIATMARLVKRILEKTSAGLFERNDEYCNAAIAEDDDVDQFETEIDRIGIELISQFQPVASDLRFVVTCMKLGSNLERMADQAVAIARRARKLNAMPATPELAEVRPLFEAAQAIFSDALRSFTEKDEDLALTIKPRDRAIDALNKAIAERLTRKIEAEPAFSRTGIELIFIARYLERIGDYATNMAEDVVFELAARDIRHATTR